MIEARQWRGDCVESVHPISIVAVSDGDVILAEGDDRETAFRSACKPHQLAVSLSELGDPPLSSRHLAVGAASHSGEPAHTKLVQEILDRFGAKAEGLRCGAHPPAHAPSAEAILRAGGAFTDLHNNCSGKHAFMLSAALHNGWDLDYRAPDHPLQIRIKERLGAWASRAPTTATDGCGVPTFVLPLSAAARAWGAIARAMRAARSGGGDAWDSRLARAGWAMAEHPEITSGTGRLDLSLVSNAREPMAVKIGAVGLFCVALPERGIGFAVKAHSGSTEALPVAVEWALSRLAPGAFERPASWEHALVRNVVGKIVGRWECRG